MRTLLLLPVFGLLACGSQAGSGHARWTGLGVDVSVTGKGRGGWCAESGMVLLEVSEGDKIAGLSWRAAPLVADSAVLDLPSDTDTVGTHAAAAARYIYLDEVRGYRAITGMAHVTSADTLAFSATVEGRLQRLGEEDTVHFTATFDRVPLTRDLTLCRP
ncbi:MAG TPA: hypothetical protein VF454_05680 [Gemmatimonadales bacterium]